MNFPGVEFVEKSHHDERVKDDGEVLRGSASRRCHSAARVDVEHQVTCGSQSRKFLERSVCSTRQTNEESRNHKGGGPKEAILTGEKKRENYAQLIQGLTENIFHHCPGNEWFCATVRSTEE